MPKNSKIVEVLFKGERRAIYRDRNELDIKEGEYVIVEAERGNYQPLIDFARSDSPPPDSPAIP